MYYISMEKSDETYLSDSLIHVSGADESIVNLLKSVDPAVDFVSIINVKNMTSVPANDGFIDTLESGHYLSVSRRIDANTKPRASKTYKNETDELNFTVKQFTRNVDNVDFYVIQVDHKTNASIDAIDGYARLADMIKYIKDQYPGNHIIVGNFNVLDGTTLGRQLMGNEYHYCFSKKTHTNAVDNYMASTVGLIVSKSLYASVEFKVDLPIQGKADSRMFQAKLVRRGLLKNSKDCTEDGVIAMSKIMREHNKNYKLFYDMDTAQDLSKIIGDASHIKE